MIDPQPFGARVAAFLREIHPDKTAANVEADAGIAAKTVAKWLELASSPSGSAYQRLIEVYGAELVVHVSPEASNAALKEAGRICRQARLERAAAKLHQRVAELWDRR